MYKLVRRYIAVLDAWTKDKDGKVVLYQSPNLPIKIVPGALLLSWIFTGRWEHLTLMLAFGCFFVWAWLEIFYGVNMFRRCLGILSLLSLFLIILY